MSSYLGNYLLPLALVFISLINEIFADPRECDNGPDCPENMYCCSSGCCYQDSDHTGYHSGYRLTIWNMWYFWFIVIFVLMACFSGCGYYKQRQRLLRSQHTGGPGFGFFSVFQMRHSDPSCRSDGSRLATQTTDIERQSVQPQGAANQIGFWSMFRVPSRHRRGNTGVVTLETGYSDNLDPAHSPPGATLQPPPYSEVISNPHLFPSNTKIDLPPYTQQSVGKTQSGTASQSTDRNACASPPQPPPYSEIANQNSADFTASQ